MTYDEKIDAIIDIGETINYLHYNKYCPNFLVWQFDSIDEALKKQKEIAISLFNEGFSNSVVGELKQERDELEKQNADYDELGLKYQALMKENAELKKERDEISQKVACLIDLIDDLHPDGHDDLRCEELGRCVCGNDELRKEIGRWKKEQGE